MAFLISFKEKAGKKTFLVRTLLVTTLNAVKEDSIR